MGAQEGGVVERITGPLAAASLPVMFVSTVSHDYVLIPADRLDDAMRQFAFRDMWDGAAGPQPGTAPASASPASASLRLRCARAS